MYYDPLTRNQIPLEPAFYLSNGHNRVSLETSTHRDVQLAAYMQACFEVAGDKEPIAEPDLG